MHDLTSSLTCAACVAAVPMLSLHVPEEERSVDILELIEQPELLTFHEHTLELYRAVCSQGNHRVARELTKHVTEEQLKFAIVAKCQ